MKFELLFLLLSIGTTMTSSVFPAYHGEPGFEPGFSIRENTIDDSTMESLKTSSAAVAQFRSLVDPEDRYQDVWEAVGRGARSK